MRKTYQMILALLLCAVGATNVNAEEISLQEVPFWQHEVWGKDEPKTTEAECEWVIDTPSGLPYGDSNVINFADLSNFIKLKVTVTAGTPRFLFNRDIDEGQWNETESESHLIDNTKGGWSAKYFTSEAGENEGETVYIVDLKQLVTDKGYAHLHAIKGANWQDVTVTSMVVESKGKANKKKGWVNLINNSSMEGDDVSSFFTKVNYGDDADKVVQSEIVDGAGVNESRGIIVSTGDKITNDYDNQFWFRFNEPLKAGDKYRVSFDYAADESATVGTQSHAEPSDYIHWDMLGNISFTSDWQTFTKEGVVTADQSKADKQFLSVAFNLNPEDHQAANNYYFDNIKFEKYFLATSVYFSNDVILVDFGNDTNMGDLVKESGAKRVFFTDKGCVKVTVNGTEAELYSVEGLEDGRFYIFLESAASEGDDVVVDFTNNIGLVYTSGDNVGGAVEDFADEVAEYNGDIEYEEGAYPYDYVTPTVMKADPEDGSFNLPNDVVFKLYFDKEVDCSAIVATANGKPLTVSPAEGFAQEVSLTAAEPLANGECKVVVTKIYPKELLSEDEFGTYEYTVNIGEVEIDPNDQPEILISVDNFNNTSAGGIPEGFQVNFNGEIRTPLESYGSGPRMFTFSEGGDFTRALYFREGYTETFPALQMTAHKNYTITFNLSNWKGSNSSKFEILDLDENVIYEETFAANANADGNQNIVMSGTTKAEVNFIPEENGEYTLRWNSDGFVELLLANVKVEHQPNVPGMKETIALNDALAAANATLEACSGERYDGEIWNNLQTIINKYTGWSSTAPSAYQAAIDELNAASSAMNTHRQNCDEYDTQVKKAIDVVRQNEMPDGDPNKATKFVATELFAQLKATVAKYNGSSEWRDVADHSGDDEAAGIVTDPQWQLFYEYDILKDDAELTVAIAELKDIANVTSLLFTEGFSAPENANGGKGTGVAVLIERLRLGAEALKVLGAADDDPLVVAANNALTDDDALADAIKHELMLRVYGNLKEANNTMFEGVEDENTMEIITPTYDMTVFVKNPNTYKQLPNANVTEENVPGWVVPEGYNSPGLTHGWGAYYNIEGVAEDCMFQTWGSSYRIEQTITDLPAGIYTVRFAFGERNNGDANVFADSYAYAADSSGEYIKSTMKETQSSNGEDMFIAGIGQAFPFCNNDNQVAVVENVEVIDGQLTIGVNAGPTSHTFFNEVRLLLAGPADGFDYADAYVQGIDTKTTNVVRHIELYDLNGRRLTTAQRGLVIVKKHMADGTIKAEKVLVK